jgi:exodeoxyribonuclease V alpha subunit
MESDRDYIEIAGTVRAILFSNEDNGYTVIKVETQDGETVTAVGCLPGTSVGEQIILTGEFVKSPTHGEQFKAEWAQRRLPVGADAIYDFLASRSIKGIGPATATLLVSAFGDKTLAIIENEPERLSEIRGISRKKAKEISDAFCRQIVVRRLLEYLANFGVRPVIAVRLYKVYGDCAMARLEENPYIISRDDIGASFAEADALALGAGFEGDAPERIAAAALFELRYNTRNGHCFIPYSDLVSVTGELIGVSAGQIEEAIEVLVDSGEIVRSQIAEKDACYLASLYSAETYVADRIKQMAAYKCASKRDIDKIISQIEAEQSVTYANLQTYSLKIAAGNRIMVLTGGPGTGKTTAVRGIVSLFDKLGLETLLTAPTGRAAKRMSELSGCEASTIHRLLEAGYTENGDELVFRRNEREPLKCDAIILDECSMVDITLMKALLCAMPPECRLVLVGDADQLPSVGPGNVFNDIIRSGIVETVRLTDIFRQNESSRIVANAHRINRGDYPELRDNRQDSDFFFLGRSTAQETVATVKQLCSERLPEKMGIPAADIQVLSPTRKGETGTRHLNIVLQEAINPAAEGKKEKKYGEIVFREGDRVMQIRNNYDIIWRDVSDFGKNDGEDDDKKNVGSGIFNGDIGEIMAIDPENELVYVLFDDKVAAYGFDMLSELEHAFAVTVHKSQGSEYRAVIFIAMESVPQLMNRKVLYTAVTRARELLIVVGNDGAVFRMIDNHKVSRRYSGLRARLIER